MQLAANYILNNKKSLIKKYKKKWKSDVKIVKVPLDITMENVNDVLEIMIETGYTFIVSYMIYKSDKELNIISMKDIEIAHYMSAPSQSKISARQESILIHGDIPVVTLNSEHMVLNGYSTILALKRLGEKYVPYVINDDYIDPKRRNTATIRLELFEQQQGRCYICNRETKLEKEYEQEDYFATVDHIIPVTKGGDNKRNNCRLCCKLCNSLKSNFTYSEELKTVILRELQERGLLESSEVADEC